MKNKLHNIQEQILSLPRKKMDRTESDFVQRYLGTTKKCLGVKTGVLLEMAKEFAKTQDEILSKDLIQVLDGLFGADTFEEHAVGGKIFTLLRPQNRAKISFEQLEGWLSKCKGWVEVDVICQSSFTGAEVLARWNDWRKMIERFRQSDIIALRRASLVLQTQSARKMDDQKIRQLAFETVDALKHEKDVLITKAVSWLLRALTWQNKDEVKEYLEKNESSLPRIAFRETMKKIETGKK